MPKGTESPLEFEVRAQPRFCRPRSVAYAIKHCVRKELDRLETAGILRRVNYAEWAEPIVPVPKKDGSIRICGDYRVTINPAPLVDQYPLLKPTDLMTCLAGGHRFSQLDLSSAYQQVELDEESTELVMINTHMSTQGYPLGWPLPRLFFKRLCTVSCREFLTAFVVLMTCS